MRNYDRRPWTLGDLLIRLVILLLGAGVLLALQLTGYLQPLEGGVNQVTSPAEVSATSIAQTVADFFSGLLELRTVRQRNIELERINASLQADLTALKEVAGENQQLRQFFNFAKARPGLELRGAQIVGRTISQSSNNFLNSVRIDLGQRHGIKVGMPVVTDQGLVGRISEVRQSSSDVLQIDDVNSFVNVILQSSRLSGGLRGDPSGNLIMDYIAQSGLFNKGELVLTSGLGGNFPKGIPIGTVIEIRQRDVDVLQQAIIQPVVDLDRIELVLVITNFDPQESVPE